MEKETIIWRSDNAVPESFPATTKAVDEIKTQGLYTLYILHAEEENGLRYFVFSIISKDKVFEIISQPLVRGIMQESYNHVLAVAQKKFSEFISYWESDGFRRRAEYIRSMLEKGKYVWLLVGGPYSPLSCEEDEAIYHLLPVDVNMVTNYFLDESSIVGNRIVSSDEIQELSEKLPCANSDFVFAVLNG